jgi:hypothetical protein
LDKIEDPNQRLVVSVARQLLAKALETPSLPKDRIVRDRASSIADMTTEAWASGDLRLSKGTRGSLSAAWAKHENGSLNVTIAGECNELSAPNGQRIGEFVVFIQGKSPIEKGFDIQTQSEVNFWIGKLSAISTESNCLTAAQAAKDGVVVSAPKSQPAKSGVILEPVITQRGRQYMAQYDPAAEPAEVATASGGNQNGTTGSAGREPALDATMPPADGVREPSSAASIILPDRAVAGQSMTAAVIGASGAGEPAVELNFNGKSLYTDKHGCIVFSVPDDATPGRSLSIKLAARAEAPSATVDIFQPLSASNSQQAPKLDRLSIAGTRIAIIDGHNFEGSGSLDRVMLDGQIEAKILAASPVQVKALLPSTLTPGVHNISITIAGKRSAAVAFKVAPSQFRRTAVR